MSGRVQTTMLLTSLPWFVHNVSFANSASKKFQMAQKVLINIPQAKMLLQMPRPHAGETNFSYDCWLFTVNVNQFLIWVSAMIHIYLYLLHVGRPLAVVSWSFKQCSQILQKSQKTGRTWQRRVEVRSYSKREVVVQWGWGCTCVFGQLEIPNLHVG